MNYNPSRLAAAFISLSMLPGLAGCEAHKADIPPPVRSVELFLSTGKRQCDATFNTQQQLARAVQALERAGVKVLSASCGTDGLMHPAMCGASSGEVWIMSVSEVDAASAKRLGYQPITEQSQAHPSPCN